MNRFSKHLDSDTKDRKYNINKFRLDEDYDFIIELINTLDGFLTRKTDDELTHQLLNPKIRQDWVTLMAQIYYACTTFVGTPQAEIEYDKLTYLGLILRLKNIESRIIDVSLKMSDTYQYLARLYGNGYQNEISKIVDRLVNLGYINEKDKEEEKTERMNLEDNFINKSNILLRHALYATEHEINGYSSGCINYLSKVLLSDDKELKELTVSVIRNYCKTFYTPTFLTNLRHEAVKLMGGKKYTHVERENWIDLLTNEDKFIKLGKLGNALEEYTKNSAEDARFEFYGEDRCKILDDNPMLMDIMLSVNYGLELFDLEGALNNYNLLFALNENNLQLFCEMILRRNVMLGMIEPELKKEFEEWLNPVEQKKDNTEVQNSVANNSSVINEKQGAFLEDDIDRNLVIRNINIAHADQVIVDNKGKTAYYSYGKEK